MDTRAHAALKIILSCWLFGMLLAVGTQRAVALAPPAAAPAGLRGPAVPAAVLADALPAPAGTAISVIMAALIDEQSPLCAELRERYPGAGTRGDEQPAWEVRRERLRTALARFRELFPGVERVVIGRAPGRFTLNEHTDYNGCTSLGVPTEQDDIAIIGLGPTEEGVRIHNMEDSRFASGDFTIDQIRQMQIVPVKDKSALDWRVFVCGLLQSLFPRLEALPEVEQIPSNICLLVDGREEYGGVPVESNMSSSAALEESIIYAVEALVGGAGRVQGGEVIEIGREAEALIGFPCGKLDQGSSTGGRIAVEPGRFYGAAIDCVSRKDARGEDATRVTPFPVPENLNAVLVDMGPKPAAQREYNIRVIEGELAAWLLARSLRDILDEEVDIAKVARVYPPADISRDHNGKPYLYNTKADYPVFFKPVFFAASRLRQVGVSISPRRIQDFVRRVLPRKISRRTLLAQYADDRDFLSIYLGAALPYHMALARGLLEDKGVTIEQVDDETLTGWVKHWLVEALSRKDIESMGRVSLTVQDLRRVEVTSYNLCGTMLHAISEEDRVAEILSTLRLAVESAAPRGKDNAIERFGLLQRRGFESLRTNYRNSTKQIGRLEDWARKQSWCLAVRHFGAGWGGWVEVWVQPGRTAEAEKALKAHLSRQKWYKTQVAEPHGRSINDQLACGMIRFSPGTFASLLGEGLEAYTSEGGLPAAGPAAPAPGTAQSSSRSP